MWLNLRLPRELLEEDLQSVLRRDEDDIDQAWDVLKGSSLSQMEKV